MRPDKGWAAGSEDLVRLAFPETERTGPPLVDSRSVELRPSRGSAGRSTT